MSLLYHQLPCYRLSCMSEYYLLSSPMKTIRNVTHRRLVTIINDRDRVRSWTRFPVMVGQYENLDHYVFTICNNQTSDLHALKKLTKLTHILIFFF